MYLHLYIKSKGQTIIKNIVSPLSFILIWSCFNLQETAAQQVNKIDSADLTSITSNLIRNYQKNFQKTTKFYNGAEYIRPLPSTKGHPFLDNDSLRKGNVLFDGILYNDVLIAYDIVTGVLITKGYQNINLIPVPQNIEYFTIDNRLFVPIPDSIADKNSIHGYFEVLYQNELMVLAHYKKTAARAFKAEDPYSFKTSSTYYIQNGQKLTKIDSEKKLLELFADNKDDVRSYIRKNNLSFKKIPVPTIIKSVDYYLQLTQ